MSEDKECRELEPCPFCGGGALDDCGVVACDTCGAMGAICETDAETIAAWNRRAAKPTVPENYVDYQQRRGAHADIVDEAIAAYEQWMLDDDYDAVGFLKGMVERMRERSKLYVVRPVLGWISVKDRMPEPWVNVLVTGVATCGAPLGVHMGILKDDDFYFADADPGGCNPCLTENVTHWMPLPASPTPPDTAKEPTT